MLKLNFFLFFFILASYNSSAQISLGVGSIYNGTLNQTGMQIRLTFSHNNYGSEIKYENYFLKGDQNLYALRFGFFVDLLTMKKYSIYSHVGINLTGFEGLNLEKIPKTTIGQLGGNLGLGFHFFMDKKKRWKIYSELDLLFLSKNPEYSFKKPLGLHRQVIIGFAYVL